MASLHARKQHRRWTRRVSIGQHSPIPSGRAKRHARRRACDGKLAHAISICVMTTPGIAAVQRPSGAPYGGVPRPTMRQRPTADGRRGQRWAMNKYRGSAGLRGGPREHTRADRHPHISSPAVDRSAFPLRVSQHRSTHRRTPSRHTSTYVAYMDTTHSTPHGY
jgi:hypothetical protein